jgi:hypothetical protein
VTSHCRSRVLAGFESGLQGPPACELSISAFSASIFIWWVMFWIDRVVSQAVSSAGSAKLIDADVLLRFIAKTIVMTPVTAVKYLFVARVDG